MEQYAQEKITTQQKDNPFNDIYKSYEKLAKMFNFKKFEQ